MTRTKTRKGGKRQEGRGRELDPGLDRLAPPPFYDMHEHDFEELDCAVMCTEAGISSCDLYGVRGQTQHGADLVAPLHEPDRIDVAQCKCYAEFSPRKIVEASNKFLDYWDAVWRFRNVRRFVLIVACDLSTIKCQHEIDIQTKRFAALGVKYEAWSARIIANKLASHPHIVGKFLPPAELWIKRVCGEHVQVASTAAPVSGVASLADQLLGEAAQRLLQRAARGIRAEIEEIQLVARRGNIRAAGERLAALEADRPVWATLEAALRAKVLRMRALLMLQDHADSSLPKQLAAEADSLEPGGGVRLRSLIAAHEGGPRAGLAALGDQPGEPEEFARLRAGFLLELGQGNEATACLEPWGQMGDHESLRVLALALLSCGRTDEAEMLARRAVGLAPDAWATRMVFATVLYYRGLAKAAIPKRLGEWPEPPPWHLVQRDEASVVRFREADGLFARLGEDNVQQAPRAMMDVWRLSCLANDAARRGDAEAILDRLLQEDRTNPAAITWALARALPIDLRRSRDALEDAVARGGPDPERVAALAAIHLTKGKPTRALAVLQSNEATFENAGLAEGWRSLVAQAGADVVTGLSGEVPAALGSHIALIRAVRAEDRRQGEADLATLADRALSDEHDPARALECLLHLAERGRWELVAPRVNAVLPEIATADAVHLAAMAKAAAGDPRAALDIMDRYVGAFPEGRLPGDLRRVKVDCQRLLGRLPIAVSEAATLVREEGSARDLLTLADLFIAMGNTRQAAITVRQAREKGPLPASHALRFAHLLAHENPALGRELWQGVGPDDLERRYLPLALDTAHRLGLASQSKAVLRRLVEGPDDEVVQTLSLNDLPRMLQARREEAEQLWFHHEQAKLPSHVLAPRLGYNLAGRYHAELDAREGSPEAPGVLLAQHGSRRWLTREQFPPAPSDMRLIADVTALLLAQHIGVLDTVERYFSPIRIPQQVPFALQQMRDEALPADPCWVADARKLLGLVGSGRVHCVEVPDQEDAATTPEATSAEATWLAAQAAVHGGAVVDWSAPDNSVPPASAAAFMNPSGFIELLQQSGLLDDTEASRAREAIGSAGEQPSLRPALAPGAPIYFRGNTAAAIMGSGVVERACEAFRLHLEQSAVNALEATLLGAERGRELADWVASLVERVRRGLEDGTYEALPDTQQESRDDPVLNGPLAAGLRDLLAAATTPPGGVIWADDRMLSAQWALRQVTVISTPDVLEALVIYGHLREDELERKLLKLRAGQVLFIDPRGDEVGRSLLACRVEDAAAVETQAAAIHRRYLARGLLQDDRIRAAGGMDCAELSAWEAGFVVNWTRATDNAIQAVWSDKTSPLDACAARADLALQALYIDQHHTLPLRGGAPARVELAAMRLAFLLAHGWRFGRPFRQDDQRRVAYLRWLDERLIRPRLAADPHLRAPILRQFVGLFAGILEQHDGDEREFLRGTVNNYVGALPEGIRAAALADPAFTSRLGINPGLEVVPVAGLEFPAAAFWAAAKMALREGRAALSTVDGRHAELRAVLGEGGSMLVLSRPDGGTVEMVDPIHELLLDDVTGRDQVILRNKIWLDLPEAERRAEAAKLAAIEDDQARMHAVIDARSSSAAWYYEAVADQVASAGGIEIERLRPPSAASLLQHLRLHVLPGAPLHDRLAAAARTLIAEEGLDEAFERLSGLPIRLPMPFVQALASITPEERRAFFERWQSSPSPMARVHLLRLACDPCEAAIEEFDVCSLLDGLLASAEEGDSLDALLAVLAAANCWFPLWPGADACSTEERLLLCWAHAGRLLTALMQGGLDASSMRQDFRRTTVLGWADLFSARWALGDDVAHPASLHRAGVLLHALQYATGDRARQILGEERIQRLRKSVLNESEVGRVPILPVLRNAWPGEDALGSFLAESLQPLLAELFGEQVAACVAPDALVQLAGLHAEELATGKPREDGWLRLAVLVGERAAPPSVLDLIPPALASTPVSLPEGDDLSAAAVTLRFLALQASRSERGDVAEAVERLLAAFALDADAATGPEAASTARRRAALLLEVALALACREQPEATAREFASLLSRLGQPGGIVQRVGLQALARLCRDLPLSVAEQLWPRLLEVRATS